MLDPPVFHDPSRPWFQRNSAATDFGVRPAKGSGSGLRFRSERVGVRPAILQFSFCDELLLNSEDFADSCDRRLRRALNCRIGGLTPIGLCLDRRDRRLRRALNCRIAGLTPIGLPSLPHYSSLITGLLRTFP